MNLTDQLNQDFPPEDQPKKRKPPVRRSHVGPSVFELARDVDTKSVLDWLGLDWNDKHAKCPGCGEPGALICKDGGLKCLHNRCSEVGPPGFPGFRSNVDIVVAHLGLEPLDAARGLCDQFGIEYATSSNSLSERDAFLDQLADDEEELPLGLVHEINSDEFEVPEPLPKIDAAGIFEPLPPLDYLVQKLDICPGAPTLFAGYGFSGKTAASQQLAIDVTQGAAAWGAFPTKAGRVIHIDYEQGSRLTRERYQRLAVASTIGPQDLKDRLALSCFPPMKMDSDIAEEVLLKELDGYDLCIIDSLKASSPSVDENSSDVRRVLDTLNHVSEKTGCACLVIHHSRKPQKNAQGGARMAIRGSSGIYDACASVLVFDGQKGLPTRVHHEKARNSGILADDFDLIIDDVEMGGNPRAGLMVAARTSVSNEEPSARRDQKVQQRARGDAMAVADIIRKQPGVTARKLWSAAQLAGVSKNRAMVAVDSLGSAVVRGAGANNSTPLTLDESNLPEWFDW